MGLSINTNVGAMIALQNLTRVNNNLSVTQDRLSTGLRVNTAKDDAASFAISTRMKSDVAAMSAVKTGIGLGDATMGVAVNAGESIKDLLIEMKSKAVQAQAGGLSAADRTALDNDVAKLIEQVDTIVASAEFNGVNLIENGATNVSVLASVDGSQTITMPALSFDKADLGINALDLSTAANAATALTAIDTAIGNVAGNLATFGSTQKQLEIQGTFTQTLIDSVNQGIGKLIDADMAAESARLTALQTQQQLAAQSLSIANSTPQIILSLFGG